MKGHHDTHQVAREESPSPDQTSDSNQAEREFDPTDCSWCARALVARAAHKLLVHAQLENLINGPLADVL